METQIEKYKLKGKVYVWKYLENKRNYPGWNLTVNKEGAICLEELLELIAKSKYPSRKLITTSSPTVSLLSVPNNRNGKARWTTKNRIQLNYKKFANGFLWNVKEEYDLLEINFGEDKLKELKEAIKGIPEGLGDFTISDMKDENILYFWWNLDRE